MIEKCILTKSINLKVLTDTCFNLEMHQYTNSLQGHKHGIFYVVCCFRVQSTIIKMRLLIPRCLFLRIALHVKCYILKKVFQTTSYGWMILVIYDVFILYMNHTVSNKSIQETNFIETRRKEPGINKSQIKELLRTSLGKSSSKFSDISLSSQVITYWKYIKKK